MDNHIVRLRRRRERNFVNISFGEKMYSGRLVAQKDDIHYEMYVLETNPVCDKYLVIIKKDEEVVDFNVTGTNKIQDLLNLAEKESPMSVRERLGRALDNIYEHCFNKKLKRLDTKEFRKLASKYHDDNYVLFVFSGIKFPEIFARYEKEMA
jgi:hypothetical protein